MLCAPIFIFNGIDTVDTYHPGAYVGGLETLNRGQHNYIYVGSATGPDERLNFRVHDQHESPHIGKRGIKLKSGDSNFHTKYPG